VVAANTEEVTHPPRYSRYVIEGGVPLHGAVRLSGAKNAVTKMIVASLLSEDPTRLRNAPRHVGDVGITSAVTESVGTQLTWSDDSTVTIVTPQVSSSAIPAAFGRKNRLAILTAGPLLHRTGEAIIPFPGGDRIGPRPINFHVEGLRQMGAQVDLREGAYHFRASRLRGTTVQLPYPSVGATETLIIAATMAQGVTIIQNAAIEPEIIDLVKFLQKMGAIIEQRTDRKIVIEGVQRLHGADHRILADRMEAVSLAVAAYVTHGDVKLLDANQDHLLTFLNTLYRIGLDFTVEDDGIRFGGGQWPPKSIALETDVHPGFMTDWQQPFTVLLTQTQGMSVVHETLYEDRFGYTSTLRQMGADIGLYSKCLGELPCRFREREFYHSAIIRGPTPLHGTTLDIPDIRAGCSYIVAALCATGVSNVYGIEHIERGYEQLDAKLKSLGAHIEKVGQDAPVPDDV
jgi:UDP-N-acetylglucosamine 1-carboxyvinyltransferase